MTVVFFKAQSEIVAPKTNFISIRNQQLKIFLVEDDFLQVKTGTRKVLF